MTDLIDSLHQVSQKHNKYPVQAYLLIYETLDWLHQKGNVSHLTGADLSQAMFSYSLAVYGLLSKMVWRELNILRSEDIGNMVYHLLDEKLMNKQETDNQSDFDNVLTIETFDAIKMVIEGKKGDLKITYEAKNT